MTDWPALLALSALLIGLAAYGWHSGPTSAVNRWFAFQTLALAGWVLGVAGTHTGYWTEFWGHWTFACASIMPAAFLGFARVFPDIRGWPSQRVVRTLGAVGLSLAVASAITPWVAHSFVLVDGALRRRTGPLFPVFALYFIGCTVIILGTLVMRWRRATGLPKAHLQYYSLGLAILAVGGITTNLLLPHLTGHSEYSTVGPFFVIPLVLLIGHAIIRHRLFDLRIIVSRGLTFAVVIGLTSAFIAWITTRFGTGHLGEEITLPLGLVVVLLVAGLFTSLPVAPRLTRLIDSYLMRGRPDLASALQEGARQFSRFLGAESILAELERILDTTVAPEHIALIPLALDEHLTTTVSPSVRDAALELSVTAPELVLVWQHAGNRRSSAATVLRQSGIELVLSLGVAGQRSALVLLGARKDGRAYFEPTLRFLENLTELASIALEVSRLHRRQLVLERDRQRLAHLARLSRVYAVLAHEIRTPLTTISNLVAMLPDRLDDPEFRDVMVRLIPSEVARIAELAERLRGFAPEAARPLQELDIAQVVEDLTSMLSPEAQKSGIALLSDIGETTARIRGDRSRLMQLFQNLVRNALEASTSGGEVWLRVAQDLNGIRVRIIDNGKGIDLSVADSLFEAFVTTKPSGLGLGLSVCWEIAKEHEATISVSNRTDGKGALAEVIFPFASPGRGRRESNTAPAQTGYPY